MDTESISLPPPPPLPGMHALDAEAATRPYPRHVIALGARVFVIAQELIDAVVGQRVGGCLAVSILCAWLAASGSELSFRDLERVQTAAGALVLLGRRDCASACSGMAPAPRARATAFLRGVWVAAPDSLETSP